MLSIQGQYENVGRSVKCFGTECVCSMHVSDGICLIVAEPGEWVVGVFNSALHYLEELWVHKHMFMSFSASSADFHKMTM